MDALTRSLLLSAGLSHCFININKAIMGDIVAVELVLNGQFQVVAVAPNGPIDELQGCIAAVFQCVEDVVGVKDVDSNIVYPISILSAHPKQFGDSVYEVMLGQEVDDASTAGTDEDEMDQAEDSEQLEPMSLAEKINAVRESVGLDRVDAINLDRILSKFSETEEIITRFEFMTAMHTLGDSPGKNSLVSLLFDVFSQGAEFAMISELVNGLSVFCAGTIPEKVLNSFALQDTNRDGYISRANMVTYMRSVFTLLFQISPDLAQSAGCDPEDLAVKTTNHAFQSMSLKSGELMSFAQYKVWYVNEDSENGIGSEAYTNHGFVQAEIDSGEDSDENSDAGSSRDSVDELDIFQVQSLLGLHESKATDVTSAFLMFADEYGRLSKPRYMGIFDQLLGSLQIESDIDTKGLLESIKERVFNVYEIAESGFLNVRSLTSGISLFCGGSWDDKALAVFMAFGLTSAKFNRITPDVMSQHIISIFAMMSEFDRSFLSDSTAVMVAQDMVKNAFEKASNDRNLSEPAMSCTEFAEWLSSGAENINPGASSGATDSSRKLSRDDELVLLTELLETSGSSSDEDEKDDESESEQYQYNSLSPSKAISRANASMIQHELRYAKRTLGLHMFSADDLLDVVGEFSKEGVISALAWDEAIVHMLTLSGISSDQFGIALELSRNIFDRLDVPGLGAVDYSSLILSLVNFCSSPLEDRAMVAFTVLEASRGSEVDYDELIRFFRTLYMAATVLSPTLLRTMVDRGTSPDNMAQLILNDALLKLNFVQVGQQYFNLENLTEIAEYCLERLQ